MRKEIFVGFVFDEEKEKELHTINKCGVQIAANQYQKGFMSGLQKDIDVVSALSVGTFPKGNKRLFFKKEIRTFEFGEITYLTFINFYLIRETFFFNGVYKYLLKEVEENQLTVYVYSLYMPFLKAIKKLKKRFNDRIKVCLIIPDLPGKYGIMRSKFSLAGIKDRLEVKKKFDYANYADSFVFLTENMNELFDKKPYTVIEGFLPYTEFDYTNQRKEKTILYTGSLNSAFGVDKLIEAFKSISDPEYRLWICGAGGIQNYVEKSAKEDQRIKYFGFLSKQEIAKLQTKCDVLINPRLNDGVYTKYSFPSKTMEYMLSGSKVLMYRLSGIPNEYYRYIYEIKGNDIGDISRAIQDTCNDLNFYKTRSQEQINWIKTQKSSKKQVEKISEIV